MPDVVWLGQGHHAVGRMGHGGHAITALDYFSNRRNPSDVKHAGLDVFRVAKPGHLLLDCFIPQEEA